MPVRHSYDYAVVRVVPCAHRGEFVNVGLVLHCPERAFLEARNAMNEGLVQTLWPELDLEAVRRHLAAFPKVCSGDAEAGPIAQLSRRERFHWMVAPRSTVIQTSAVHSGLCESPEDTMRQLMDRLVLQRGQA